MIIKEWITFVDKEIKESDSYLKDLPEDIENVKELSSIIGNNKDMSRAYDLGRREALSEIKNLLKK